MFWGGEQLLDRYNMFFSEKSQLQKIGYKEDMNIQILLQFQNMLI